MPATASNKCDHTDPFKITNNHDLMVKGAGTIFAQSTESTHDTTEFIHDKNRFQLANELVLEQSSKFCFGGTIILVWTYFEYLEISVQASYLITSITDGSCENSRQLTTLRIVYLFILLGLVRAGLLRVGLLGAGVSILWSADTFTFIETISKHKSNRNSLLRLIFFSGSTII